MKKDQKSILVLLAIFVVLLSTTLFVSFSSNIEVQEVVVKSITPVYDSTSTIEVDNTNVVFNDKNQVVDYKVVIENTQNYDVKITDITLSTPTEEFLQYTLKDISKDDVLAANSTKELIISLETMGIEGWGRNFNDELTANVSFERVRKNEPVDPPKEEDNKEEVETPKEEIKQPEPPAPTIKEVIKQTEKIEPTKVTKDVIEFKEEVKVEVGDKIAVWIYSEPIFLGYFDVVETNGVKQIVGLEEALKKADIEVGEHNIVLETEDKEVLGYVEIYINEDKELSSEKPQDTNKEEIPKEEDKPVIENKPSTDNKDESEEDGKVENPYTSDKGLLVVLVIATGITGLAIIVVSKNKFAKYTIFIIALSTSLALVNADKLSDLPITINANFKSQNVMKPSGLEYDAYEGGFLNDLYGEDYWYYAMQIKNFYIQNEIEEIDEYEYEFDVTDDENGKVMAYLVERNDGSVCYNFDWEEDVCYDLYLQADGIIYPNEDASYYFAGMRVLDSINNLNGIDTSEVTSMRGMFSGTGEDSEVFTVDLSNFDTSNVTDMSNMFVYAGYVSPDFTLDLSNFNTSNVTNMSRMFVETGYDSENFTLDISNFDTSNVTDMRSMFDGTGLYSENFTLDVSNFDTSKVTDMSSMFWNTGYRSTEFTLDVSNFDTSNVTDMSDMFLNTGYNSTNFTLDVSNFDTSKVTDMSYMFCGTGYNSENFALDVSNFDTSNVTDMSYMFRGTGYSNESFTLDLSNFDTSKVTDMSWMLNGAGYNSTKLNTSITISNPNTTDYNYMFGNVANKDGTQIKVNYTNETELLVDKMIATKPSNSNVVKGNLIVDADNLSIGDEIHISGEKFNIISQTDDTVTMLAQYSLGTNYKQSTTSKEAAFANTYSWEYAPGPKEIDIQQYDGNVKTYVNSYIDYLRTESGDSTVTGSLIILKELGNLGCTVPSDYARGMDGWTCEDSPYDWLVNDQWWWTSSASSEAPDLVWSVNVDGILSASYYFAPSTIRPTITISKQTLQNLNKL